MVPGVHHDCDAFGSTPFRRCDMLVSKYIRFIDMEPVPLFYGTEPVARQAQTARKLYAVSQKPISYGLLCTTPCFSNLCINAAEPSTQWVLQDGLRPIFFGY